MRKLFLKKRMDKKTLDEIAATMPVLSEREARGCIGGSGNLADSYFLGTSGIQINIEIQLDGTGNFWSSSSVNDPSGSTNAPSGSEQGYMQNPPFSITPEQYMEQQAQLKLKEQINESIRSSIPDFVGLNINTSLFVASKGTSQTISISWDIKGEHASWLPRFYWGPTISAGTGASAEATMGVHYGYIYPDKTSPNDLGYLAGPGVGANITVGEGLGGTLFVNYGMGDKSITSTTYGAAFGLAYGADISAGISYTFDIENTIKGIVQDIKNLFR